MKTTAAGGGGSVKAPAGNHMAVLVGVFEMGTQTDPFDATKARRQVCLAWELVNEEIAGTSKNHVVSAAVTQSLNEKATLRKWVESRTGKKLANDGEFDLTSELGQACMLNVVANEKGYTRVEGVAALPNMKGMVVPKPGYKPVALTLEDYQGGAKIPDWVPWIYGNPLEDHINASHEIGKAKPNRKSNQQAQGGGQAASKVPASEQDAEYDPEALNERF